MKTALVRRGPWAIIHEHDPAADQVAKIRIRQLGELPDEIAALNAAER
jgi:hypothetical protein